MQKPCILHMIDTTGPGGAETIFVDIADYMHREDFDSIVVIRDKGWVYDTLIARGITPILLDCKGSFNFKYLLSLLKIVKQYDIRLIHSHLLGSNVYASLIGILTRIPVVATYHGMVDVNPNERFRTLKRLAMQGGIQRYVAVSQSLLTTIEQIGLLNSQKSLVIYNGINMDQYNLPKDVSLKSNLGLSSNDVLLGCLGNIRPAKAYDVLLDALPLVIQAYPNVHVAIAGHKKESLMKELTQRIQRLGVEDKVHFLGYCEDSAKFLSQIDLYVLCSRSEGLSISTIEAMATGLPVIVTRCGGPEEIVRHLETGYMVDISNPNMLADGLKEMLENKVLRENLARAAKLHALATFDTSTMIQAYKKLYQDLIH